MENVLSTITALFAAADERNWQQVASSFDEMVFVDYTSTTGKAPAYQTPQQIADSWAGILPGFDKTQHQMYNIEVSESLDSATANWRGKAEHFIDKDVWIVEGVYESTLHKKGADWVISQFKFVLEDWTGNSRMAQIAIERVKNRG